MSNKYTTAAKHKVCIIGAGTAGLCAAKNATKYGLEVTIFEQTKEIGGTWVYTERIGIDEYGIDVHSSLYQGLRTNLPKEVMGYPDFSITTTGDDDPKSYVEAEHILSFLKSYAKTFDLEKYIKYLQYVVRVQLKNDCCWQVIVKDLQKNSIEIYYFEFVLVCNGHYNTPLLPKLNGTNLFKGRQLHSHDYKSADDFKGENILVIGAGPSGMDLANIISKTANHITLSHHLPEKPKTKYPKNVTQKPDVKALTPTGAIFSDGTTANYTVVLYCTGYKYAFPFLNIDCGIHVEDNFVQPLYKHCINIEHPSMAFVGLPFYVCAAQMIDLQSRFILEYFTGRQSLPCKAEMLLDTQTQMQKRWENGFKKRQAHMMGPEQINYYNDLAYTANIENVKPVMTKLHNESSQRFMDDLLSFREENFRILDDDNFIKIN